MPLPAGAVALNLGCGVSIAPGWINIDNSPNARLVKHPVLKWSLWKLGVLSDHHYAVPWATSIRVHNLKKRLPYPDASVDYVYTSHFLEHLTAEDARRLISEVFRVLKPCGLLRLVVPDLAIGAGHYVEAIQADPNDARAAPEFLNWLQLGSSVARDPHCWMYDAPSLAAVLRDCGFVNPVVSEYRKGRMPDCEILDNRPDESLFVEAEKP